ncbi:MAG TPA: alpha/beta hydrolase [Candidatus Hydrogenedentes bacterium]|nr:alpha/beta hydrolase [Candidatus Hydrogenedentota bacterium]
MAYEGRFESHDGLDFFERRWDAETDAAAHVVLVHGYGEHCSRYAHVGAAFGARGLTVHTYDQRGFGRSPGKRAYIADFDLLLSDLDVFIEHVRPSFAGKPWFLMGHSMGGLVVARYAQTRGLDAQGLVFWSPFLGFTDDVSPLLLRVAALLGVIAPWLPVGAVDNAGLSRDPAIVEAANNDALAFHGRTVARTGSQFYKAITAAHAGASRITLPAYLTHGSADSIVPKEGTRRLHDALGSADKTLVVYEEGYHELWNDLEKEKVIEATIDWMHAHV